jgi:hypothetical protein
VPEELADQIEGAVAAHRRFEESDGSDNTFEDYWRAIAVHAQDALEPLTVLLAESDANRRATAGYLLGRLGETHEALRSAVTSELLRAVVTETDDDVIRAIAAGATLSALETDEAIRLLREANPNLRRVAAHHLGLIVGNDIEDEPIREALRISAAADPDPDVRWWARFGLDTSSDLGPGKAE